MAYSKEYYEKNRDAIRAAAKRYYENNKERHREYCRKWREKNPAKYRRYYKKWNKAHYHANREAEIKKVREYTLKRLAEDPGYADQLKRGRQRWYYSERGQAYMAKFRRKNRAKTRMFNKNWRLRNQDKIAAHKAVRRALLSGELKRPDRCQNCSQVGKVEGHHENYSKPLEVMWLCRKCHIVIHPRNVKKQVAKI